MNDRLTGHRDSQSDTWSWEEPGREAGPPPRRGPPWQPISVLLAALGLAAIVLGLILILLDDDDNGDAVVRTSTPSRTRTTTATPASEPSPEPEQTPTPASEDDLELRLLAWSRDRSRWLSEGFTGDASEYREGESVPFLVRLDGTFNGTRYEISVRYQCSTENNASFDYLSEPSGVDSEALISEPGPERARADSTIPLPDDPSITFDDGGERRFQVWGATFQQSPEGPTPAESCDDTKEFRLIIVAHDPAVFLIWAGHLASADDWGVDRGASSQNAPLFTEVSIGGEEVRVNVGPDVIVP